MAGMTFNLNNVNGTAVVRLKAWGIYDVVFKGIELVKGKNKEGNEWKAMKIKFSGEEGIFEPLVFCPGEGGGERVTGETGGKKWELPSALEQLQCSVAHVMANLAPEMMEKFSKAASGLAIPEDFEKLVEIMNKALAKAVNKQTKLKLIGNNKGYASLPNFVGINKEGEVYINNNWLGDTVAFSDYEVKKMNEQKNAKPTAVKDDVDNTDDTAAGNEDLDFEV
jgi:hypothetical protein